MAAERSTQTRRDRWADWAVVGVVAVALLLGWGVKSLAEGQRKAFSDSETGLSVRYPTNWLLAADERSVFQAIDPGSGEYKTRYQVRVQPIDATGSATSSLNMVLNNASLLRAQELIAYRMLDLGAGREIGGHPSMEASYVGVHESSDLFSERMPVVVRGMDVAIARGDRAYIFSLLAAEEAFDDAQKAFRRFVESAEVR
jgi:hypothetical protein